VAKHLQLGQAGHMPLRHYHALFRRVPFVCVKNDSFSKNNCNFEKFENASLNRSRDQVGPC
jgi:hypothetical protein